jgi:hypothetical protein
MSFEELGDASGKGFAIYRLSEHVRYLWLQHMQHRCDSYSEFYRTSQAHQAATTALENLTGHLSSDPRVLRNGNAAYSVQQKQQTKNADDHP